MKRHALLSALFAVLALGPAGELRAQVQDSAALRRQLEERLGAPISQQEIMQRLQESGMTLSQARARLQSLGYDPDLADIYFDALDAGSGAALGNPDLRIQQALERLGPSASSDSARLAMEHMLDPTVYGRARLFVDSVALDSLREGRLPIFGMALFENARNQFVPPTFGPVGEDYRLGPGDQLVLILTGSVEDAYELRVTRQGFIVIPGVGQLFVSGLTMDELESRLYDFLGRVYSGIERGGATGRTRFQISLAELRRNQVYVVGEVQEPGAYQVSAVSSVLNALYQGGGPSGMGSFRRIEVRRAGRLIDTVDLYDFLLTGGSRPETQLENGDRVFVPVVGTRVAIEGEVKRPARYELHPDEGLRDLLAFAGGFRPQAVVDRVQIDRILPASERRPGVDRVLIDVPLEELRSGGQTVELRDGDRVNVFTVSDERRRRVALTGEVNRPGVYQWTPGMRLRDVISRAGGLAESAYTQRVQVYRLDPADGTRHLIPTSLERAPDGQLAGPPFSLEDRDSVVVHSRAELMALDSVAVRGYVKAPGAYPYARGMTLEDLVLAAGGFTPDANTVTAELARMPGPDTRSDTAAAVYQVQLEVGGESGTRAAGSSPIPDWRPAAGQVRLQPGDRVFVRQAPGYSPIQSVAVTGEVQNPGTYALAGRGERLLSVLARAGGFTDEAYEQGLQLVRDSMLLGADLQEARRRPDGPANVPLDGGDSIYVPQYEPTVRVTGAVVFESRVVYVPGAGIDYYIEQAGGYAPEASSRGVSVTYMNGERDVVRRFGVFIDSPEPAPGSVIHVPAVSPQTRTGISWGDVLSRGVTILGTVATIVLALRN